MSIQCYVPRLAYDALDLPQIIRLARFAGVERPRIESSTHKIPAREPAASVRVTCSEEMALALIEAFRQQGVAAGERQDADLLIASAHAVAQLFAAIDDARRATELPGFGRNS